LVYDRNRIFFQSECYLVLSLVFSMVPTIFGTPLHPPWSFHR
jgi:hypothetical protein